jgi:predicted RNA binding protein YcfA (HicA-like mRNA interferase family)
MTAGEMVRVLKKEGCKLVRHGRNHDIWENPKTGALTEIPRHSSQDIGSLENKIKKDLGL